MNGGEIVVRVEGLTKVFGTGAGRVDALRGIDLDVAQGEFVAVMGPSGSGKSTLLHLIGGLDTPTSGSVEVAGRRLNELDDDALTLIRRRRLGFVFQAFNLITVLTAEENVALPLAVDGLKDAEATQRAVAALELTGLTNRQDHYPRGLSGGEQQRVAVARALVNNPLVLLADEPTGNLDSRAGDQIMTLLRRLADEQCQTIIMVTHDKRHASVADRLITLGDGLITDELRFGGGRSPQDVLAELEADR